MLLPIEAVLPALTESLCFRSNAVLVAPPGAGKTTRVPLALLTEPWLAGRRILMLEPRRLAARAAARYMATLIGESVGETIGYRMKMDSRVGPKTRIEVITEGILTRLLQADPALEDVGIVIFDEFHERSLHADLGLALCLQSQAILREDLRLLVMSATLTAQPIAEIMADAPIIISEGTCFPVETHYLDHPIAGHIEPIVVKTLLEALQNQRGDILAFLPGAGEIRRVAAKLAALNLGSAVRIAPLYGNLSQAAQDLAIAASLAGERKIVLATSIAETSLTVVGVGVVIDSGLMRIPRFSPRTGMTRLVTVPVSRSSADQRRGRAGRLGPGVCYRLWSQQEDRHLELSSMPEILAADLAPLALELAAWGVVDPRELQWLDQPPQAAFFQAHELLSKLGALDTNGLITPHGRRMAGYGLSPRLTHMILQALPLGLGGLACELAVLISDRDVFRGDIGINNADLRLRIDLLRRIDSEARTSGIVARGYPIDGAICRRLLAEVRYLKRIFAVPSLGEDEVDYCGLLLAFAYPDRIAQRRSDGFLLRNGRGAVLSGPQFLGNQDYLVAAELDDQGTKSRIFLAAPLLVADLIKHFGEQMVVTDSILWNHETQSVRARQYQRLGALVLKEGPLASPDPQKVLAALLVGISEEGLVILPWTKAACQLRQRIHFMSQIESDWPAMSDEALVNGLTDWLGPYLYGLNSRADLQRLNLTEIFAALLTWKHRQELDQSAPTHLVVPSGQRIPIDYSDPAAPVLAVRLQELFGLQVTPSIARGKIALTLHLLSPARRLVQVTRDLANFWRQTYFDVKKDLMARYPKHYWPDDPLQAVPTNRIRPRS
jgi:ATP-dependent helicase HrpB